MKISVIMPFFNAGKFLIDAIDSILNQTFTDFEFIIINDASTDDSDKIIQDYLKKDDRIVYIKNTENKGIVYNLNKGLEIAKGEFIARMDGDDVSMLYRFEKQINFFKKNPDIDIIGGYAEIIDENNIVTGILEKPLKQAEIKNQLFMYLTIIHGTAMIKKSVYDKIGGYKEEYLYTEDNEWTYRAILGNGFIGGNIDDILYKYRKHSNSTNNHSKLIAKRNLKLRLYTLKQYKLKIGIKGYLSMYLHYLLGIVLTGEQQEKIIYIIKKIIIKKG